MPPPFITTADLQAALGADDLAVLDASWYLPALGRDPAAEFLAARVPGVAAVGRRVAVAAVGIQPTGYIDVQAGRDRLVEQTQPVGQAPRRNEFALRG